MLWTIAQKFATQDGAIISDWKLLLVIVERTRHYHLSYNPEEKRFADGHEFQRFEKNREPSEILCAIRDYFEVSTKSEVF